MITQESLINEIKVNFGLNIYEVKIWTALLSRGIAAAGELSEISNVPRSRAYDVLENLEKKGFIIMKVGRPIKYIAVQPEEIIKRVKKNVNNDKEYQIKQIDKLRDTDMFNELDQLHKLGIEKTDINSLSGSISGRNNIYNFIKSAIDNANNSVIIVSTKEGLIRKSKVLRLNLTKAMKRGVELKIFSNTNDIPLDLRNNTIKKIKHDSRIIIVDNNLMIYMLVKDSKNLNPNLDSAIWIKSKYFINSIEKMLK